MKSLSLTIVALLTLVAAQAKADRIENQNFNAVVQSLMHANISREIAFQNGAAKTELSPEQFAAFNSIALSQAEIWGDTILEGDYEADGKTQVDRIEALRNSQGELLAYHVQYSEKSWDTSTCDMHNSTSLRECKEGRIEEATFVSPDLKSWTRDSSELAMFSQNK